MRKFLFGWIDTIPLQNKSDRNALVLFELFILSIFMIQLWPMTIGFLPFISSRKILIVISFVIFGFALLCFFNSNLSNRICHRKVWRLWNCLLFFSIVAVINGVCFNREGNNWVYQICVVLGFYLGIAYIILMGRSGILLFKMLPIFIAMYYISVFAAIYLSNIQIAQFSAMGYELPVDEIRNTSSAAYLLKGLLSNGIFLFILGIIYRGRMKSVTRWLCIFSIVPYLYFFLYMFKFRTSIVIVCLSMIVCFLCLLRDNNLYKLLLICVMGLLGIAIYFSGTMNLVRERFQEANDVELINQKSKVERYISVFNDERIKETKCMFNNLSFGEILIGKGFNSYYDASDIYGERGLKWSTTHLGFFSNILRGGIGLFVLMIIIFLGACMKGLCSYQRSDGFLHACKCYVIVETFHYCISPMLASFLDLDIICILFLCIGALWSDNENKLG